MYRDGSRWWLALVLLTASLIMPVVGIAAQETSAPELTMATRIHVAGPDTLFLDGVVIGGQPYAVYLSADRDGHWRVTAVDPIDNRTIPTDVNLDLAALSTPDSGELRIDNIYLDGQFYSGTVAFDPSFQQIQTYEFSTTPPPNPAQSLLLGQLADSYEVTGSPPGPPPPVPRREAQTDSVDQALLLERLDEYAAHGDERLDRLEARIAELTRRVDAAVVGGSTAVAALMDRVTGLSGGARTADYSEPTADEISPTLSLVRARSEMASVDALDLSEGTAATGMWRVSNSRTVIQTDPDARFAKFTLSYRQDSQPRLYRVLTRASGEGWAGVGIHLGVADVEIPSGYGHGRSVLVWLTRDVQVYGTETTFLEVYVSYDDVTMNRVAQSAIDSDLSTLSALEVLMDPGAGMLTVAVDGIEHFRYRVSLPQGTGFEVALRALGEGEFSDLEVRRR